MEPLVSFIIPVYNEEKKIKACLESIYAQNFKNFEVILVDDDSDDRTLEIAKQFGNKIKIFRNGSRNYEIGKAIGVSKAKGKYFVFIDADNRLIDKDWLAKGVEILEERSNVLGVQSWKFYYSPGHNFATRYIDLFGNMDPLVFYLKSQDHLKNYEKKWKLAGEIVEDSENWILVKFKENIPTLGSQGFLTRASYFKESKETKKIQHIEYIIRLTEEKKGLFCFLKNDVEHLAVFDVKDIIRKLARNIEYSIEDKKEKQFKRYKLNFLKILKNVVIMETLIIPFYDSLKGFFYIKDFAWFLHVLLSFLVPWLYAWKVLKSKF